MGEIEVEEEMRRLQTAPHGSSFGQGEYPNKSLLQLECNKCPIHCIMEAKVSKVGIISVTVRSWHQEPTALPSYHLRDAIHKYAISTGKSLLSTGR